VSPGQEDQPDTLRVAHVISTPTGVGGAEATLSQLVANGASRGWAQLVLNPFALDPADPRVAGFYAPAVYEGKRCAHWRTLPSLRRWLSHRLDEFRPDVVHAHLYHASVVVASLRRPPGSVLILSHQHGDHFHMMGSRLHETIDRLAGLRYDQVVGCSQSVEDFLLYRYGYSPRRVSFVRNGWRGEPIARDGSDPVIICVARFRAQKNHRALIEAVAHVREQVPAVRLQLVGEGNTRAQIEEHVHRIGLSESVEFVGTAADVWPLLARARVFALVSTYEPLGIAALEAMAAGLPLVVSAVGGLREVVEDGDTGFLVPPDDIRELAHRLTRLLRDDELAMKMGKRAREAAQRYHADRTAEGYARVYERLLAEDRV
jgi:glycosyltransferase involved in cell wall biosynthesis